MKIVPELYCSNIEATRKFYTEILRMNIKYERPRENFIYFTRAGVDPMVE